eukprot:8301984-Heterocapsa_arctica.AAC.1
MGDISNVSVVHYTEVVPKEDREAMTHDVCFSFCRSVPDMGFWHPERPRLLLHTLLQGHGERRAPRLPQRGRGDLGGMHANAFAKRSVDQ